MSKYIKLSEFKANNDNLIDAVSAYYKQIRYDFTTDITTVIKSNSEFIKLFTKTFDEKFNPKTYSDNFKKGLEILSEIAKKKEQNRAIFETFVQILDAMVRTNFYQDGVDYVSFKIKSQGIKDMPKPIPFAEIFIYNDEFEGAHLRNGPIARGGFRLSDRKDYRTENLGLVKAQTLKNVIITPSGAKACIFIKEKKVDKDENIAFIKSCYAKFVSGLLMLTDNEIDGVKIEPKNVIKYDEFDKYIVAAADKGTASFSDIANELSIEHNFWLKDAFASGGSNGYSHKDLGITSRGVYECVKNSFFELGINPEKDEITAIGIGDMSGDVFGNGMLLFKKLKLVGAFNHQHIFIDPNPNIEQNAKERQRLFDNPQLKWSDYDKSIISRGGGIFERFSGDIELNDEIRNAFGIDKSVSKINPETLMHAMLCAKVDLIWNGGIGTFMKNSDEKHEDVQDKFNDNVRINGDQIHAKVFAEGGNVGVTQRGRIQASRSGVKINMDSIDNSAGVSCSDREVNIKIALDYAKIPENEKSALIKEMKDEVVKLVLHENYYQSKLIGIESIENKMELEIYRNLINALEDEKIIDRKLQFVPDDDVLKQRVKDGHNLSRTQICVLISHVKLYIKNKILTYSNILNDEYFTKNALVEYFPNQMQSGKYLDGILSHPLKDNIIATKISNKFVNFMGLPHIQRILESGLGYEKAIFAYYILNEIFGISKLFRIVHDQDNIVEFSQQAKALKKLQDAVFFAIFYMQRHINFDITIDENIEKISKEVSGIRDIIKGDCCSDVKQSCCFDAEYTAGLKLLKMSHLISLALDVKLKEKISLKDAYEITKKSVYSLKPAISNLTKLIKNPVAFKTKTICKTIEVLLKFGSKIMLDHDFAVKNMQNFEDFIDIAKFVETSERDLEKISKSFLAR